ncbi:MAG: leader peptidase (prepilin peptidase) / N-methyltransferase [Gaiellaceae bacterium]|jgi:leader peptidase (prepilin peptidase)/N-methyltransferase|nr:leader peptidase (prepilin peptidase) / N-methyltransferase [Gaiellaceae bacterium]
MDFALAAFAFAPGLALGSFMNVVAARVPLRRSLVSPGSACMSCGHEIGWRDNVPVLSWLLLRGRCRSCKATIPWRYPAVELVSALLVAGCALKFGLHPEALVAAVFCLVLVAVSATDLEHGIIPNRIVLPAFVVILAAQTAVHPSLQWTLGALGASGFLFAAALIAPRGMGMGDVKLALVLGAMLGTTVAVGMFVGLLAAMVPAIVLFMRLGAGARKVKLPFGPFLAIGSVVALFAGHALLQGYWALVHG